MNGEKVIGKKDGRAIAGLTDTGNRFPKAISGYLVIGHK